jgi:4-amino-4-deoxy-L-arabinose transferase-like glycosyltransferase
MSDLPSSNVEASGARSTRAMAALLLVSALVFIGYYFGLRRGQPNFWNDTYEYAQAARNLAEGRGLTTDAATVLEVGLFGHAGLPLPYYLHDPGNSLLMAAFFRLVGAHPTAVGLASGVCFVLLAPLTYVLGRRVFGHETGVLAGLLVATNAQLLVYAGAGYSETPIAFCLTALLILLLQGAVVSILVGGVVFGALVLLRANALPFLPWLLLFVAAAVPRADGWWRGARRAVRPVLLLLLGAACVLALNSVRNRYWTGRAAFAMHGSTLLYHTSAMPGKASSIFSRPPEEIDVLRFLLAHPRELVEKMAWQGSREIQSLLRGGQLTSGDFVSALLFFLFLMAFLTPRQPEDTERRRFRWLVGALWATALLVGAAFHLRWRHLYSFLPVVILFAADELAHMARGRRLGRLPALGVVVLAAAAFGLGPVLDSVGGDGERWDLRNRFYSKLGLFLADHTAEDAVVLLEVAGEPFNPLGNALAWHARRTMLPNDPSTLESPVVRQAGRPVCALLVRPVGTRSPQQEAAADMDREPGTLPESDGFHPVATFTHRLGTAVLYR